MLEEAIASQLAPSKVRQERCFQNSPPNLNIIAVLPLATALSRWGVESGKSHNSKFLRVQKMIFDLIPTQHNTNDSMKSLFLSNLHLSNYQQKVEVLHYIADTNNIS